MNFRNFRFVVRTLDHLAIDRYFQKHAEWFFRATGGKSHFVLAACLLGVSAGVLLATALAIYQLAPQDPAWVILPIIAVLLVFSTRRFAQEERAVRHKSAWGYENRYRRELSWQLLRLLGVPTFLFVLVGVAGPVFNDRFWNLGYLVAWACVFASLGFLGCKTFDLQEAKAD